MKAQRYILRQKLVAFALENGIKAASRAFCCSKNTVRKWVRRYRPGKPSSLNELSRRPHHCPHKTPDKVERRVVELKRATRFGAERLKEEFDIPCSVGAIKRIAREHNLVRVKIRKHKKKKDLSEVKKKWRLFGQLCIDTKHLYDNANYWPQMIKLGLPKYQYTVREVVSGMVFSGYADELSKTYSCLLAERVSVHLARHGIKLEGVQWQSDNGSEFKEGQEGRGFPSLVKSFGSGHHYIPVKAYTWQSDVETVHKLVEDEFFDLETFTSKADFWKKITIYWYYFNIARANRHKEKKTPLQIIMEQDSSIKKSIAVWQALDLTSVLSLHINHLLPTKEGGHNVPVHPYSLSLSPAYSAYCHLQTIL